MHKTDVFIIGAGPAGLTCATEILNKSPETRIVIAEMDSQVGGISKTVNHNGNRIDIGGHRFFSKSDWVMDWWTSKLPLQSLENDKLTLKYQGKSRAIPPVSTHAHPDSHDNVLLVRNRLSRIYYKRRFFDYPLKFNADTFKKLGIAYTLTCGFSYLKAQLFPVKNEKSLEDFLVNRFGNKLYRTFFKDYTEKVWGVECDTISAEWGAQRIKGVSVKALLASYLSKIAPFFFKKQEKTSLIESFLYPKFGPGQMWETVADTFENSGGLILLKTEVVKLEKNDDGYLISIKSSAGEDTYQAKKLVSTMPVSHLLERLNPKADMEASNIASKLPYRDFITVGLLVNRFSDKIASEAKTDNKNMPADNWIYIQESDVKVGRLQIFNNWSPYMVNDKEKIWMGLEYFCNQSDGLWKLSDDSLIALAKEEMSRIGFFDSNTTVFDGCVLRVPKAYPAYFGAYSDFDKIRTHVDTFENLYLIGRNGMHRYNNQDHSMLTAKLAAESIITNINKTDEIWAVNIDDEYHEEEK